MNFIEDDTFIPDDDMPEEWLAQVFEVATVKSLQEEIPHDGYRERFTSMHFKLLTPNLF